MTEAVLRHRIVILTGPAIWHRNSCATWIRAGLNIVGICYCDQRTFRLPLRAAWKSLRTGAPWRLFGQILGRAYYEVCNGRKDRAIAERILNLRRIEEALKSWNGAVYHTSDYSRPETIAWLASLRPDVFLVHTPYWVGKKVRDLAAKGITIGGHPGLTPWYRGSYSPFWAIYRGHAEDVGASVFWLSGRVDAGDLVVQERIAIEDGDSHVTLGWKGMSRIAEIQARVLDDFDHGVPIPRRPHREIPPDSVYPVPTLLDYLRYRRRQKRVR
jgi:hypothetical protein